ncbi:MAG: AbgT family transporter [Pseudomonadota bacterium]|jgi:aminobenzoyl-glutamate transport protein
MSATPPVTTPTRLERLLGHVERIGNRLPDPAVLFLLLLGITLLVSAALSTLQFSAIDPRSGEPLAIVNLLAGRQLTSLTSDMVTIFTGFHPLGVVLVAMLGIGVAEHVGFINAGLRALLAVTSRKLLTPMLIVVALLSHLAVDAGYVLVIPLGGVIFHAAGRHPLAGIAAAFAGVSGGFSASFLPVALDAQLAGITQEAAGLLDAGVQVNPLVNYYFTTASSLLIVALGWWLTDRVIEPRLLRSGAAIDGDMSEMPRFEAPTPAERRGLRAALLTLLVAGVLMVASAWPGDSAWRSASSGALTAADAPIMRSIVALIFLFFLLPSIAYGIAAGTVKSHRDVVQGMSRAMGTMSYYMVLVFFMALFIAAFNRSNLGVLLALEGGAALKALGLPLAVTMVGIVLLTCFINLFVGSATAKWALLAPIFVPMLMQLDIDPATTQAAYRVGDSSTNIITPLMPYFPLVVVFCQRYVKSSGIGTVVALMLPYSVSFLVGWSLVLVAWLLLGLPMGVGA